MLMDLSQFGQSNQNQQYYQDNPQPASKKKLFLIIGGVALLLIALVAILFSGGSKAGQPEMKQSLQAMSDAIAAMDEYQEKLQVRSSQNDVALVQIIIRGNYQKLNELYAKTYNAKKFSESPKVDEKSKEKLDAAVRNNTIDSEILIVVTEKSKQSQTYLKRAKPSFSKPDSVSSIQKSIEDFDSIQDTLNRAR